MTATMSSSNPSELLTVDYPPEYIEAARKTARRLAARHRMAFFDQDDLEQELVLKALLLFPKWVPGRGGPEPFLRRSLSRLICNLYRDRVRRSDSPCPSCQAGTFCGRGEPEGGACRPYAEWAARWGRKALLMRSGAGGLGEEGACEEHKSVPPPDFATAELVERLEGEMPADLRADFLRLRQGMALTSTRRAAVLAAARTILAQEDEVQ